MAAPAGSFGGPGGGERFGRPDPARDRPGRRDKPPAGKPNIEPSTRAPNRNGMELGRVKSVTALPEGVVVNGVQGTWGGHNDTTELT